MAHRVAPISERTGLRQVQRDGHPKLPGTYYRDDLNMVSSARKVSKVVALSGAAGGISGGYAGSQGPLSFNLKVG